MQRSKTSFYQRLIPRKCLLVQNNSAISNRKSNILL
jgi:hypothetical protein